MPELPFRPADGLSVAPALPEAAPEVGAVPDCCEPLPGEPVLPPGAPDAVTVSRAPFDSLELEPVEVPKEDPELVPELALEMPGFVTVRKELGAVKRLDDWPSVRGWLWDWPIVGLSVNDAGSSACEADPALELKLDGLDDALSPAAELGRLRAEGPPFWLWIVALLKLTVFSVELSIWLLSELGVDAELEAEAALEAGLVTVRKVDFAEAKVSSLWSTGSELEPRFAPVGLCKELGKEEEAELKAGAGFELVAVERLESGLLELELEAT